MKVLISGATGFVGRGVGARLQRETDVSLRALVRDSRPLAAEMEASVVGDLRELPDLRTACADITHVVHLAARVHVMRDRAADATAEYRRANVDVTVALARAAAAAGARRFVYVSSVKAQGEHGMLRETDACAPSNPYGVSKREAELALLELAASGLIEVVILRPPLVYGAGVGANFAALMRAVNRGIPLPFGAVDNRRSLVARSNLADLIAVALRHPGARNQIFNVSDGEDLSTAELVRRLARALDRPARLVQLPPRLLAMCAALLGRKDLAQRLLGSLTLDITRAKSLLAWTPPVSVDDAFLEMVGAWRGKA